MPFKQGPEPLAQYLTARGLRYVGYTNFAQADYGHDLAAIANPWVRAEADRLMDFQDNLAALTATRHRLYDDGETIVLDLATRTKQ